MIAASAGLSVRVLEAQDQPGGGSRTAELTLPGFHHDICAGAHPMALASPFFRAFDLAAHGVDVLAPTISYAHPLDGGIAGLAWRDLEATVADLGVDGQAWRSMFAPLIDRWPKVVDLAMSDLRTPPTSLSTAFAFGMRLLEQGSPLWNRPFHGEVAPAMLTGVAAHAITQPRALPAVGAALLLGTLAHVGGWVIPRGGSQAIPNALMAEIGRLGGEIVTGHRVDDFAELADARAVLFDTSPAEFLRIAGDRLPERYRNALKDFRYGGAACKVDFALGGPVPWTAPGAELAGTLHLVGTRAEAMAVEKRIAAGKFADRPYVIAIQPGVVDDTRAPAGKQTFYTYAHVPNGSTVDVSAAIEAQVERFAPGFKDLILAKHVTPAAFMPDHNANYVGGDISAGAMTLRQTAFRPLPRWNPYSTPLPSAYLCSSSTPPGPGVHGMPGLHAARHMLRTRFDIKTDPLKLLSRANATRVKQ
ncbi:dehydrogenase [Nocardia camponoti]|uniref:Pyridine nucleotide-disulfide oxidoreductase domain-containing protein 2 n=1 Tax=Nocardia camponoti TaxID=1616106 RepID=A0A917V6L7_9NOCA|nr:dehydrogenase [Nocardia camponoti]